MFQLLKQAQAAGTVQLDPLLCTSIPTGITTQQLVDVVVKYGETFPELTYRPFTVLAMSAMRVAWPCENERDRLFGGQSRGIRCRRDAHRWQRVISRHVTSGEE